MVEVIQSLFHHQEWADTRLLRAAQAHQEVEEDSQFRSTLHHIVTVQRAFLSLFMERGFDMQKELQVPTSLAEEERIFIDTHCEERSFVTSLGEADLARVIEMPWIPGSHPSLAEALMQVVMHSQNHRGQCLSRLRILGRTPPTLDFIIWLKDRPAPA
jgi:uncharacterized damage-inducible protein DinB